MNKLPRWAQAIRERRKELHKSQERVVADSKDALYQTELSRVERGIIHPTDGLSAEGLFGLLEGLDWTPVEFTEATGLKIPNFSYVESVIYDPSSHGDSLRSESRDEATRMMHMEPFKGTVDLPVWGSVGAGILAVETRAEPERYVRFDRSELPRGVEVEKLVLFRVNGDSMLADNVPRPIPPGSMVMVELAAAPSEGDVVVAWIEPLATGVLKLFGRTGEEGYLRSYKPGGPSFWTSQYPDMRVVGVVRRVTYES